MWKGTTGSIFRDATTVVLPKITAASQGQDYVLDTMFPNATSVHIVGNTLTTTVAPITTHEINIDATGATNIETLILGGTFATVDLDGNTNLSTLTFDATAEDFILNGSDLASADITLVSAPAVTLSATAGKTSVAITGNTDLTSITVNGSDDLNSLVITGNGKLSTISFPDLDSSVGTDAIATITGNNFSGVVTYATAASAVLGTAGSMTSTSGLNELVDFLDDVITCS